MPFWNHLNHNLQMPSDSIGNPYLLQPSSISKRRSK